MKVDTEQIQAMLEAEIPSIVEQLKADLKRDLLAKLHDKVATEVSIAVIKWVSKELVPQIHESLLSQKTGLLVAVEKGAAGITKALSAAMVEQAKKSLEDSWSRRSVLEALFKD